MFATLGESYSTFWLSLTMVRFRYLHTYDLPLNVIWVMEWTSIKATNYLYFYARVVDMFYTELQENEILYLVIFAVMSSSSSLFRATCA